MTTVWTYPWVLDACGIDRELEALESLGVDTLAVASHYHSVQTIAPRAPESMVDSYPGGCFFDVDDGRFVDQTVQPHQNRIDGISDPLERICETAHDHDFDITAWTVCNHNTKLGASNPGFRIQDAFGESYDHALCPSWPAVQEYFGTVVDALVEYDVDQVDLESVGFPSVLHNHGSSFGHSKHHTLTSPVETVLYSQCFCAGCRERADDHPVDMDAAQARVQSLLEESMQHPDATPPSLTTLVETEPSLRSLFEFRHAVIDDFLSALATASGDVPLNYYVADGIGRKPTDGWPAGIRLGNLGGKVDTVTALCYTDDAETARRRTKEIRSRFQGGVHIAVTTDPETTPSKQTLTDVARAAHAEADGDLYIYNHSLLGADQLSWVADLVQAIEPRT